MITPKKRNYKLAIRDGTTAIQLNRKHTNAYHNRGAYTLKLATLTRQLQISAKQSDSIRGARPHFMVELQSTKISSNPARRLLTMTG
jgi:hypothetical protein